MVIFLKVHQILEKYSIYILQEKFSTVELSTIQYVIKDYSYMKLIVKITDGAIYPKQTAYD